MFLFVKQEIKLLYFALVKESEERKGLVWPVPNLATISGSGHARAFFIEKKNNVTSQNKANFVLEGQTLNVTEEFNFDTNYGYYPTYGGIDGDSLERVDNNNEFFGIKLIKFVIKKILIIMIITTTSSLESR